MEETRRRVTQKLAYTFASCPLQVFVHLLSYKFYCHSYESIFANVSMVHGFSFFVLVSQAADYAKCIVNAASGTSAVRVNACSRQFQSLWMCIEKQNKIAK